MSELDRGLSNRDLIGRILHRSQEAVRTRGRENAGSELYPDASDFELCPVGRKGIRDCERTYLKSAPERVGKEHIGMSREA